MKNKISLFCIVIIIIVLAQSVFTSCNVNEDYFVKSSEPVLSASPLSKSYVLDSLDDSYFVTIEDANKFALSLRPEKNYEIEPYVTDKDTLLYLVNFEDGWFILAADKRLNPIAAESERGRISLQTSNEGLLTWIDSFADEIRVIRTYAEATENEYTKLWSSISANRMKDSPKTKSPVYKWAVVAYTYMDSEISSILLPHLVSTEWGQGSPWNMKLPVDTKVNEKCVTGCVAVALAQMVYYMHYHLGKPTGLYHDIYIGATTVYGKTQNIGFTRSNYVSNSTRWNNMPLDSAGPFTSYVGDLMLDMGNRLGMKYSGSGSAASISTSAMSHYSLTYSHSSYNYQLVENDLLNSKPVNVTAYRDSDEGRKGHSWLIDGIGTKTRHYVRELHFEYTENWMNELEYYDTFEELRQHYNINSEFDIIEEDGGTYTNKYLFMNWGYDGEYDNGYFGTYPSESWVISNRYYKYDKKINYDFR